MSLKQQAGSKAEVDERLAALMTNANAIRAIASAVEGTLGPKGLDTMLVNNFGEVVITNDGVTILTMMEASHPAARMLINTARAQQEEVGDGTTTATIMAGALVAEGVNQVARGVPVIRVIEGIRAGISKALALLQEWALPVRGVEDPLLFQVALVAGRGNRDIADLVWEGARLLGEAKLREPAFRFADLVKAREGANNEVFQGVLVNKERMNRDMPAELWEAPVLIVDDALAPEEMEEGLLRTEAGFSRWLELKEAFVQNIQRVISLGVKLVLAHRGVDPLAEELFADAGVMVIQRVNHRELREVAEHTGARMVKRTALKKGTPELSSYLGWAARVLADEKLGQVKIFGGKGQPMVVVMVGAATVEVVGERQRIARDAASAIQAALKGGVVPGGGAVELALAREVERLKGEIGGMASYGLDCVVEALKKPFYHIVANAGFNPLEKTGEVLAAQERSGSFSLALDCDGGEIADMMALGIIDPAPVKAHAIKAAGEVAEAILRIDTIIKMREHSPGQDTGKG